MHNNIGGSNFLSSDGYGLLRMKSTAIGEASSAFMQATSLPFKPLTT